MPWVGYVPSSEYGSSDSTSEEEIVNNPPQNYMSSIPKSDLIIPTYNANPDYIQNY